MLLAHFTSEAAAKDIVNHGIRNKLHLTDDFARGCTYGSHLVLFKVTGEFLCTVGRVGWHGNHNHKAHGMVEYVVKGQAQIRSFMGQVEAYGVRHCIDIRHLI